MKTKERATYTATKPVLTTEGRWRCWGGQGESRRDRRATEGKTDGTSIGIGGGNAVPVCIDGMCWPALCSNIAGGNCCSAGPAQGFGGRNRRRPGFGGWHGL